MDIETFRSLVEVIAFECKNDPDKLRDFGKIFYGEYKHEGRSILDLDAMNGVEVCMNGKTKRGFITNYSVTNDVTKDRCSSYGGYMSYRPSLEFTLNVEIKGSF